MLLQSRVYVVWAILLLWGSISNMIAQECPNPVSPTNGQNNVPVESTISWEEVTGITGYIVTVGTTPGGGEIANEQPTGSDAFYVPPLGLPESSEIFVTVSLFFFDQPNIICETYSFTTENVVDPPACTALVSPPDGAIDVNVGTLLIWEYAPKATGYRLTISTSPGAGDIADNLDVGNVLSYNPSVNFPPGTTIYVVVSPYNENGNALGCDEQSFTTGELGDPPPCTQLISPEDGAFNVPLTPLIEWLPAPGAIGYKLYVGDTPFNNNVLDGVVFTNTSTFVLNFDPNTTYFIRIVPFNKAGDAQGCPQESFSTILGCGPYIDPDTGELIDFNPQLTFPEVVGICEGELPTRVEAIDQADGYRWYFVNEFGAEALISEENFIDIETIGFYRLEAYNIIGEKDGEIECSSSQPFEVVLSSPATIERIEIGQVADLYYIDAEVSGLGDYEYSIESSDGPYQIFSIFNALPLGNYTLYVRDKNGCGVVSRDFTIAKPPTGFPPYFSPNGDGFNDFWTYVPPEFNALQIKSIFIYDRFGKLLINFGRTSRGWDGTYNNNPMPADGYWYRATTRDNQEIRGYFSLVR